MMSTPTYTHPPLSTLATLLLSLNVSLSSGQISPMIKSEADPGKSSQLASLHVHRKVTKTEAKRKELAKKRRRK